MFSEHNRAAACKNLARLKPGMEGEGGSALTEELLANDATGRVFIKDVIGSSTWTHTQKSIWGTQIQPFIRQKFGGWG